MIAFSKTRCLTIVLTEEAFFFSQDDCSESGDQQLACCSFVDILTVDGEICSLVFLMVRSIVRVLSG